MEIEINFNDTYKEPIGSPRPRFRNAGKFIQTYMPTSYTKHKAYIQSQLPKKMLNSRLKVSIYFYFAPPKSWTKNQKLISIGQYKRTKPDIDNLIKTVLDAANDHLWKDDNQIAHIESFKQYAEEPIEVEATLKVRCKYPVWINNRITKEEEKERILDLISKNPEKELMSEDFKLIELVEVE